jgi:hypothetical protein
MKHVELSAVSGLCAEVLSELLSEKVIILNEHKEQIFLRSDAGLQVSFIDGSEGQEIVLTFRDRPDHRNFSRPRFELAFALSDLCDDWLFERIVAIAVGEIEIESFTIILESAANDLLYLGVSFGDFRTQSIYPLHANLLDEYIAMEPQA